MAIKKLIEVALPLEKINEESLREKNIRFGHPSTLHLWWARRPLAAARAVIWASLVDDPSAHPEEFPTEELQSKERRRLFDILDQLVVWDNLNDVSLIDKAKREIEKSNKGRKIEILDPFAGGGAIPFEAQRLGLTAHAHDLNPVAVTLNKAMIEIPPRFSGNHSINPESMSLIGGTNVVSGCTGLADDVRYYGNWIQAATKKKVASLYPSITLPQKLGGASATPISWIWVRSVQCQNPACRKHMPLASSFVLSKKKGREAWAEPFWQDNKLKFEVHNGKCPKEKESVKVGKGASFRCCFCGSVAEKAYIRDEIAAKRVRNSLMAVVADNKRSRVFLSPTIEHELAAESAVPEWMPQEDMNTKTPDLVSGRGYGITKWNELFTQRQLTTLTTISDLITDAQSIIERDALSAGMDNDHIPLVEGGVGALAYSQAVCVYLTFGLSRMTNIFNALCRWESSREQSLTLFSRQAIPMIWDFAENNPFAGAAGDYTVSLGSIVRVIETFSQNVEGFASQKDAQSDCGLRNIMVSTDPPYYDNIAYADLSDFFYIWLRKPLKSIYPDLFSTMMVPKAEELTALSHRFDGDMEAAKEHFEKGMLSACRQIYRCADDEIPVTIFYAYKQSDTNDKQQTVSTGWETMLSSIVQAGFIITGTWPIRTEMATRQIANGTNALASSIVLVCRKRSDSAQHTTRRNFVNVLRRELRPALKKLQENNIAPVDLAQSAIGPGIGVYSRFASVLEADGTPMSVRSALQIINQELDLYFNEQDGDLDSESRFCVELYSQIAFNEIKFGDANTLATAKNTSVAIMSSHGILYAQKGVVRLIERAELPERINNHENGIWLLCQQLTYRMEKEGVEGCAKVVSNMFGSNAERSKDLAYRLYTIAERKKWAAEAYAYNALVVAWPEIQSRAAELKAIQPEQMTIFDI